MVDALKKAGEPKGTSGPQEVRPLKKRLLVVLGAAAVVLGIGFAALAFFGHRTANKYESSVEAFVTRFYRHYNARDTKYIYDTMADEILRRATPREKFGEFLNGTLADFGEVTSRSRSQWHVDFQPLGVIYKVDYKTRRKKKDTLDSFTLRKKGKDWVLQSYFMDVE